MRTIVLLVLLSALLVLSSACEPSPKGLDSAAPQSPPPGASASQVHGNLAQVMRGVLFPNSNVIFAAQSSDPAKVKPAADPSTATDPLASAYGGWTAVENAGLAIAESANLLTVPGRKCQNGKAVPLENPDWAGFVQGLREAGMAAYTAAQSRNQDKILEAADTMTIACMKCHDKYREKPDDKDRCM